MSWPCLKLLSSSELTTRFSKNSLPWAPEQTVFEFALHFGLHLHWFPFFMFLETALPGTIVSTGVGGGDGKCALMAEKLAFFWGAGRP